MAKPLPIGIRNKNIGNIRSTKTIWKGETTSLEEFETFDSPEMGIRAAMLLLAKYYIKYGLTTIRGIINRWAPPVENDTGSYQDSVALVMGYNVDDVFPMNKENLIMLVKAIGRHENGRPPQGYPRYWYEDDVYERAYNLAIGGSK